MENKYVKILGIIGLVLIIAFFVFGKKTESNISKNSGQHMMPNGTMMDNEMHSDMLVASDEEFIKGMIPHHEEAVSTAKEVLARGGSFPEIKTLAENIITSQTSEIEKMKMWYKEWFGNEYVTDDSYVPMMRDLSGLSGVELDKVFLQDMIMHHMGAIMMANQAADFTEREEIKKLSTAIIEAQENEISMMREWLTSKFK